MLTSTPDPEKLIDAHIYSRSREADFHMLACHSRSREADAHMSTPDLEKPMLTSIPHLEKLILTYTPDPENPLQMSMLTSTPDSDNPMSHIDPLQRS